MKIGIIGLLPDQVARIKEDFPEHSLEFLSKERMREARDFATRHNKVVLMTKFIGHPAQDNVPNHKRVLITGGLTKLRAWINTQATTPVVIIHKPVHKEPAVSHATEAKVDYKALMTAKVGEVLEFHRPAKTTIAKWESQINSVRSYYRSRHGIVTTATFKDSVVSLQIVTAKELTPVQHKGKEKVVLPVGDDAKFWQRALIARMHSSLPMSIALQDAEAALAAFREKFGGG